MTSENTPFQDFIAKTASVQFWTEEILGIKFARAFFDELQSGVVLCYLMLRIEPRSIPRIQENTSIAFKLKENIRFFLDALEDFGMRKFQMFFVQDLFERQNLVAVVDALAHFADLSFEQGKTTVKRPDILQSSPELRTIETSLSPSEISAIKSTLSKLAIERNKKGAPKVKVSGAILRHHLKLLGGSDEIIKVDRGTLMVQTLWRMYTQRRVYLKMLRHVAYRDRVAKEILETEQKYVGSLEKCVNIFLKPLEEAAESDQPIISKSEVRFLFSNLRTIVTFSSTLLIDLKQRIDVWSVHSCLADIFVEKIAFMKVYIQYIQNYNQSITTQSQLKKNSRFVAFLEESLQKPECEGLSLGSYLIMPIQRIPRYSMLLQDIKKHTWESHPDYVRLLIVTEKIQEMATELNQKKKEAENLEKMIALTENLTGKTKTNLAEPHRRFISELQWDDHRFIYLFNDLLLSAKTKKLNFKHEKKIKATFFLKDIYCLKTVHGFDILAEGAGKILLSVRCPVSDAEAFTKQMKELKMEIESKQTAKSNASKSSSPSPPHVSSVEEVLSKRSPNAIFKKFDSVAQLEFDRENLHRQLDALSVQLTGSHSKKAKKNMSILKDRISEDLQETDHKLTEKKIQRGMVSEWSAGDSSSPSSSPETSRMEKTKKRRESTPPPSLIHSSSSSVGAQPPAADPTILVVPSTAEAGKKFRLSTLVPKEGKWRNIWPISPRKKTKDPLSPSDPPDQ